MPITPPPAAPAPPRPRGGRPPLTVHHAAPGPTRLRGIADAWWRAWVRYVADTADWSHR